jgi:post-segregation antitoxin (ccd killing protein)
MKTEVYSWRLSVELKADLEEQARNEGKSVSALLEELASEGLRTRRNDQPDEEAQQAAIRKRAQAAIGSIRGDDPTRSERASQMVREIMVRKHAKESRASRRSD